MSSKRFRIAFSFAGEKRDFVANVANILATRFGESAILYDKYHEAEFARARLGRYLPKLYHDQSDLVVAVIGQDYAKKEWPGLEWDAVFDLLKKREESEVMLCRFDHATVEGLFSDAGYIELDNKTPDQAATLILQRLAINEGKPKDFYTTNDSKSPPVASTTIPNNLPRLQPFFGRTEELKQIAEALDPKTRTWGALIDGPGGQGKTSLAVRAAYDCTPDQFDRIIFLSVKDRELDDDGERELGPFILPGFLEILNELARELGQPDINKAVESERIRLILDALEPTKVLLILDNLESLTKGDRDKLFTFVKRLPQGCKAILTSRRRIGSGSELLILQKLDESAALETLADLARHNPLLAKTSENERSVLHKETNGNPLLLRWTAGQLGRGSCRTLADALTFLRSCPRGNDPLEFIFGDLANEFTDDETKTLVALTYFTLPAKIKHVAEVAGQEEARVEIALRTLANRSLVIPDQEERAFTLVPMVADFLRSKRPEAVAEIGNHLEQRAYTLIVENGYQNHGRFPLLDAAWPTVSPALPLIISGPNERLQTVCDALSNFLNFTGRWDEKLSLTRQAEGKAVTVSDHNRAGWCAYHGGSINYLRGQADEVLDCAERAARHWNTKHVGSREQCVAIHLRGLGRALKGEYPAAITAFREALDGSRMSSAESADVALILNALAEAERLSKDFGAAKRDYREALRIAGVVGYAEGEAYITGNLALLAWDQKDWHGAEMLARDSLILAEKVGRLELIGGNCYCIAFALVKQEKCTEALPYAHRAVEIFTRLGSLRLKVARELLLDCEASIRKGSKPSVERYQE